MLTLLVRCFVPTDGHSPFCPCTFVVLRYPKGFLFPDHELSEGQVFPILKLLWRLCAQYVS